jgi:DNA-binding transcriptional MerR regulator
MKSMDPDGTKNKQNPLKVEWNLFWEGLFGESDKDQEMTPPRPITKDQLKELSRDLSQKRKQLHKQIETLNKEIEVNSVKLESLKLVGAETDETLSRINVLSDKGQELSQELQKLNQKLQFVREREKDWL